MFPSPLGDLPPLLPRTDQALWYPSTLASQHSAQHHPPAQGLSAAPCPWSNVLDLEQAEADYVHWMSTVKDPDHQAHPVGLASASNSAPVAGGIFPDTIDMLSDADQLAM
ncbi:hypothetical protein H4R34_002538 [Dimargaris verticillata]|uniref:Uncharacterized protein n=1 Tax=Dimargaris verticillata TaxID=2761393 RepID=A0A9W8B9A5_9FUNG|nr:hypothetical protein H4R34_002538 [Dimargaris verticillata]